MQTFQPRNIRNRVIRNPVPHFSGRNAPSPGIVSQTLSQSRVTIFILKYASDVTYFNIQGRVEKSIYDMMTNCDLRNTGTQLDKQSKICSKRLNITHYIRPKKIICVFPVTEVKQIGSVGQNFSFFLIMVKNPTIFFIHQKLPVIL